MTPDPNRAPLDDPRVRGALRALSARHAKSADHPSDADLAAGIRDRDDGVLRHLIRCEHCRSRMAQLSHAQGSRGALRQLGAQLAAARAWLTTDWWRPVIPTLALAGAAALVLMPTRPGELPVTAYVRGEITAQQGALRGGGDGGRGAPGGELRLWAGQPFTLQWSPSARVDEHASPPQARLQAVDEQGQAIDLPTTIQLDGATLKLGVTPPVGWPAPGDRWALVATLTHDAEGLSGPMPDGAGSRPPDALSCTPTENGEGWRCLLPIVVRSSEEPR